MKLLLVSALGAVIGYALREEIEDLLVGLKQAAVRSGDTQLNY